LRWQFHCEAPKPNVEHGGFHETALTSDYRGNVYLAAELTYTMMPWETNRIYMLPCGRRKWRDISANVKGIGVINDLATDSVGKLYVAGGLGVWERDIPLGVEVITLEHPANGEFYDHIPETIQLDARASHSFENIAFYVNGDSVCVASPPEYRCEWKTPVSGVHTILARGTTGSGEAHTSPISTVTILSSGANATGGGVLPKKRPGLYLWSNRLHVCSSDNYTIRVTDLQGRVVLLQTGMGDSTYRLSEHASGMYLVELRIGEKTYLKKWGLTKPAN
jgi:hypothetical protein